MSTTVARKPDDVRNATTRVAPLNVANTARRPGGRASAADLALVGRLLAGDEAAFTGLVEQYNGRLLRPARVFVNDHAVAEEVVQDTWLAVLNGLHAFEGRSALRRWIFAVLSNRAKSRGVRERRSIPFSNLSDDKDDDQPVVEPERFTSGGAWSLPPRRRHNDTPETLLLQRETLALVERTVAALPPKQRAVVTLRDMEGLEAAVVCDILGLSGTNQRVLLHRGRSKVREALEGHLMKRPRDVRPRRSEYPSRVTRYLFRNASASSRAAGELAHILRETSARPVEPWCHRRYRARSSQPRSGQVPPYGRESITATVHPAVRAREAGIDAADPVPITTRSNWSAISPPAVDGRVEG